MVSRKSDDLFSPLALRSTVLETMAPLLALLCLLQLGPGRTLGKGLLGPCGRGSCCQVQSSSQRDNLFLPLSHLACFSFCPGLFPHPQAWLLSPALRMSISLAVILPSAMAGPLGASSSTPALWASTHLQPGGDARATESGRHQDLAHFPPCDPLGW